MTTTMSSRGQVVVPKEVRERCGLREGDHFVVEDNPDTQTVILRKVKQSADWFSVYKECPGSFSVPARQRQFYRRKNGLVDWHGLIERTLKEAARRARYQMAGGSCFRDLHEQPRDRRITSGSLALVRWSKKGSKKASVAGMVQSVNWDHGRTNPEFQC